MKTRIISGIILLSIAGGFLALGYTVHPFFMTALLAVLASIATYELVHNVAKVESKALNIAAMCYTALAVISFPLQGETIGNYVITTYHITVLYVLIAVFLTLKNHKSVDLGGILSVCTMPIVISYAFASLEKIANYGAEYSLAIGGTASAATGIYYLLMMLVFSAGCDTGAYFVGVTLGKHKLCPEISPKKTVEGAIGGILTSVVFALIFNFAFGMTDKLVPTLILTIPLCIVGVCGDLFASTIKRSVGLKDYGNLIPGHGGILDRFDSMLMIAPAYLILISNGVL
jgi:phosphatidate cytidylyltransferase